MNWEQVMVRRHPSYFALALAALLAGNSAAQAPTQPRPMRPIQLTEEQLRSFDPLGNCERNGRSFDMHRVMFLENRSVDIDGSNGPLRVSIDQAEVRVEDMRPASEHQRFIHDVADMIDPTGEIDIELKLAYFEGRLAVYWKETFQNRHYRQGLFNVVETDLISLCAGMGGRYAVR